MVTRTQIEYQLHDIVKTLNQNIDSSERYSMEQVNRYNYRISSNNKPVLLVDCNIGSAIPGNNLNTHELDVLIHMVTQKYNDWQLTCCDIDQIKNNRLNESNDKLIIFDSMDDMIMYEASLLQDKIKHGDYENHDQLMDLHKGVMNIYGLKRKHKDITFNDLQTLSFGTSEERKQLISKFRNS